MGQWENLLKNLGEWHGSFTRLSPQGDVLEDLPTIVSLKGLDDNRLVDLSVNYLTQPERSLHIHLNHLSRDVLVHDNGGFSQGSIYRSILGKFGAELGLRWHDRRLRLVVLFHDATLASLTLIREALPQATTPERSPLSPVQLLGNWRGHGVRLYGDLRPSLTFQVETRWEQVGSNLRQVQTLLIPYVWRDQDSPSFDRLYIPSAARVWHSQEENCVVNQLLMLPDGGFCQSPLSFGSQQPVSLGLGWWVENDRYDWISRHYNAQGDWVGVTLIQSIRC